MNPQESFHPRKYDSPAVVLSQDRMTTLQSFYPRTEGLHLESFNHRTEGHPWSLSIPGQKDSLGVVPSLDRTTPMGLFLPRTE